MVDFFGVATATARAQAATVADFRLAAVTRESLALDDAIEARRAMREAIAARAARTLTARPIDTTGDFFDQGATANPLFAVPCPRR